MKYTTGWKAGFHCGAESSAEIYGHRRRRNDLPGALRTACEVSEDLAIPRPRSGDPLTQASFVERSLANKMGSGVFFFTDSFETYIATPIPRPRSSLVHGLCC